MPQSSLLLSATLLLSIALAQSGVDLHQADAQRIARGKQLVAKIAALVSDTPLTDSDAIFRRLGIESFTTALRPDHCSLDSRSRCFAIGNRAANA